MVEELLAARGIIVEASGRSVRACGKRQPLLRGRPDGYVATGWPEGKSGSGRAYRARDRFAPDSPLEGSGFELLVPLARIRSILAEEKGLQVDQSGQNRPSVSTGKLAVRILQQRVRCEPDFLDHGWRRRSLAVNAVSPRDRRERVIGTSANWGARLENRDGRVGLAGFGAQAAATIRGGGIRRYERTHASRYGDIL